MTSKTVPHKLERGVKVLLRDNYLTYFLVVIANRVSRGASHLYRREFDIGVVEWRCLVTFAQERTASAARISEVSGTNKSLVSRALARLERKGFIADARDSSTRKPRLLECTDAGIALYARMVEVALQREATLRAGLSEAEVADLLRMLHVIFENAAGLDTKDYQIGLD